MNPLIEFYLPVRGMGVGQHEYDFQIGQAFFEQFEGSLIENGSFGVHVVVDKRVDMMTFSMTFSGIVATTCDRCLANIQLPLEGEGDLIFKFEEGADEREDNHDESVIYISPLTPRLNISGYIQEFLSLALPMVKVYDCESENPKPCDLEMLRYLSQQNTSGSEGNGDDDENDDNPFRDALKDLIV